MQVFPIPEARAELVARLIRAHQVARSPLQADRLSRIIARIV